MVESIPNVYRAKTARTFRVATSINEPLFLMTYALLDDVEDDPELSFSLETKPLDPEEVTFKLDTMQRQLDGRYKGLLEVVRIPEAQLEYQFQVEFLHRQPETSFQDPRKSTATFTRTAT